MREDVEEQITFWLATNNADEVQLINETLYLVNPDDPIKVLVHGWLASRHTEWYKKMREAYLERGNYSIIEVDWEKPASWTDGDIAYQNTFVVGKLGKY